MSDELERLHSQITNLKKQRATDVEKVIMKNIQNRQLIDEVERLRDKNDALQKELQQIRIRSADPTAIERKLQEQEQLSASLSTEIQLLRNQIKTKDN